MKQNIRKWGVLLGTGIASIIITLDFTIVATALSTFEVDFSAPLSTLQWLITAFGITFTATLTPWGRIGDTYGRKSIFLIGIIGFGLASIGAALSQSVAQLIIFRLIQGFFGGSCIPVGIAIVSSVFPEQERGWALGLYGGLLGIGLALGPFVGGMILAVASWRWLFFINIPVILASLIISLIFVPESKAKKTPIDWSGLCLLTLALASLVFAVTGGPHYGWISLWTLAPFAIFILSTVFFILSERKNPYPLLPVRKIWKKKYIAAALIYVACISFAWPMIFFAPLYLQDVIDLDPGPAGLVFLSMTAMTAIGSPLGGYLLDKKGARFIALIIFLSLGISYILQLFFGLSGPLWLVILAFIFFGFSWGAGNGVATPIALSDLEHKEDAGVVSGSLLTILNSGGVMFLAIMTSIFHYGEKYQLPIKIKKLKLALSSDEETAIRTMLSAPEKAGAMLKHFGHQSKQLVIAFREAFLSSYHLVMAILLALTAVMFVVVWKLLKKKKVT